MEFVPIISSFIVKVNEFIEEVFNINGFQKKNKTKSVFYDFQKQ